MRMGAYARAMSAMNDNMAETHEQETIVCDRLIVCVRLNALIK